jgi:hypothetical protein
LTPDRTFSTQTNEVWLARGRAPVPSAIVRPILLDGLERIAAIRAEIAKAARVATMPPVEIVPYIWRHNNRLAHGAMSILPTEDGVTFGVRLPAQTAACMNESAVRAVLVHEFAHCFYFATEIVRGSDSSTGAVAADLDLRSLATRADRDLLANPHEWFGAADAARFVHSRDPATSAIGSLTAELSGYFYVTPPDSRGPGGSIRISGDVREHIRGLQSTRRLPG